MCSFGTPKVLDLIRAPAFDGDRTTADIGADRIDQQVARACAYQTDRWAKNALYARSVAHLQHCTSDISIPRSISKVNDTVGSKIAH